MVKAKGLAGPVLSSGPGTLACISWPSVLCVTLLLGHRFPADSQLASPWGSSKTLGLPLLLAQLGPSSSWTLMGQVWVRSLPQCMADTPRATQRKWKLGVPQRSQCQGMGRNGRHAYSAELTPWAWLLGLVPGPVLGSMALT